MIGAGFLAIAGAVVYAAIPTILGVGTNDHTALFDGPATVTARKLVTPAGEVGTWHYHPGYVHNVVTQGTVIIEDGCGAAPSFSTGQAFETSEGRVHRAINNGTEDAIEYNMFIGPLGRPITVQIPGNERRCGPPSNVDECKRGGWTNFNHPYPFRNRRDCVEYVNNRRRVTLLVPEDPFG